MKEHTYDRRAEQKWARRLARRPICTLCTRPVDSELCLPLGNGKAVCEGCIRLHTRYTEDLEYA